MRFRLQRVVLVVASWWLIMYLRHVQHECKQLKAEQLSGQLPSAHLEKREKKTPLDKDDLNTLGNKKHREYNLQDFAHLDPRSMNVTSKDVDIRLVFNRVPKVGSETIIKLLKELSVRNKFTFHRERVQLKERIKLKTKQQREFVRLVNWFKTPSVYVKHVCFINFTLFNSRQPVYINMVRDPVERLISWFHYQRAAYLVVDRIRMFPDAPLPDSSWLKKDFETCVLTGDPECQYPEGQISTRFSQLTEFFCGQDKYCSGLNTEYAMVKAKENVERHFAVVGVLEDLNTSLTVFEHYIPLFFRDAKLIYWSNQNYTKINRNPTKPMVSEEVKDLLRQNLTREIDFFEFCRRRLYMQFAALKLQ